MRDWCVGQINKQRNVAVYRDSTISGRDVLDFGAEDVVIATGRHWRRDCFGRSNGCAIPRFIYNLRLCTPEDLMGSHYLEGRVVVFDDDGFYYASVAAELLRLRGCEVIQMTTHDSIVPLSQHTLDYRHIRKRMAKLGIEAMVSHDIIGVDGSTITIENVWDHQCGELACAAVVTLTPRIPDDALYQQLMRCEAEWSAAGRRSRCRIGDAEAPGLIAYAVYAGHCHARELEEPADDGIPSKRHFQTE